MKPHNEEQLTLAKCYYAIFGYRLDPKSGYLFDLKTKALAGKHDSLEFIWAGNEAQINVKNSGVKGLSHLNFRVEGD